LVLLLGYSPKNKLYKTAFIHKSFNQKTHNERLEFLGDAILSFIIAELLFLEKTTQGEGFLSQKRATIVSRKHLNLVGKKIIPKNSIKSNLTPLPSSIFGNTLEAIIGAIYIDKGINQTRCFVEKHIYKSDFLEGLNETDFKSQLLRYSQKEKLKTEYKLEKQEAIKYKKRFLVGVFIEGQKISEAEGNTKKEAEQAAAKKAMNKIPCIK